MLFIDLENFRESIWKIDSHRQLDFKKFHFYLFDHIIERLNWTKYNPQIIRCYVYSGEYTDSIISRIKKELEKEEKESENYKKISKFLEKIIKGKEIQAKLLDFSTYCNFLEIKTSPLHYFPDQAVIGKGLYQKGVDVQLAIDLVSHAYQDNYDVAILCSGDIDLLSSIDLIKSLGKKIIVISHKDIISKNMIKKSDYFINLEKLNKNELDGISNVIMSKK